MGNKTDKPVISDEDLEYIAEHTAATKEEVQEKFGAYLKHHPDGKISKKQFKTLMKVCYPGAKTENLENHIFPMYDFNNDGKVDFQEFMLVLYTLSSGTQEENLEQIFRVFDSNHDGTISMKELERIIKDMYYLFEFDEKSKDEKEVKSKSVTKQVSREKATQAFEEMDQDRDGKVTKEEFISACLARVPGNVSARLALGIADVFVPNEDI